MRWPVGTKYRAGPPNTFIIHKDRDVGVPRRQAFTDGGSPINVTTSLLCRASGPVSPQCLLASSWSMSRVGFS